MAKAERKCKTCTHFLEFPCGGAECEITWDSVTGDSCCEKWKRDAWKVCGICGGAAVEEEEHDGVMTCSENNRHMMCIWDGEWFEIK